jgi:hypothetical protein
MVFSLYQEGKRRLSIKFFLLGQTSIGAAVVTPSPLKASSGRSLNGEDSSVTSGGYSPKSMALVLIWV